MGMLACVYLSVHAGRTQSNRGYPRARVEHDRGQVRCMVRKSSSFLDNSDQPSHRLIHVHSSRARSRMKTAAQYGQEHSHDPSAGLLANLHFEVMPLPTIFLGSCAFCFFVASGTRSFLRVYLIGILGLSRYWWTGSTKTTSQLIILELVLLVFSWSITHKVVGCFFFFFFFFPTPV